MLAIVALAAAAGIAQFGHQWWTHGRFMVNTDDAYVTADITLISSRVQGYVDSVEVEENQQVTAGDVLIRLEDGDFRIARDVARSRASTASDTLERIDAQIAAARAGIAQAEAMRDVAEAQLRTARTNAEQFTSLNRVSVASQAQLDRATEALDTALASHANAEAAIAAAEAQVSVLQAQRAEAEGTRRELQLAVDQVERDLKLTVLRAPADGRIANVTLEKGDLVAAGARLAALVPTDTLYIEANFKETQLSGIHESADVHITFDALPDVECEGRVASLAPATGSVFSLLPADNATGNFTKVVQRVPVRIAIPDEALDTGRLRAGLSAVVEVDSRTVYGTVLAAR
ncbi:HlyD family secretion protein [Palleronia sp.]|uniref:HlyD family secretion protein n=1 Tax=Palleronia sp. TaxID=1940284 RepID=UPI0035C856E3